MPARKQRDPLLANVFANADLVSLLEGMGYRAETIPERPPAKSPDVLATTSSETMLVELKSKFDSPDLTNTIRQTLRQKRAFKDQRRMGAMGPWNSKIDDAALQLNSHPLSGTALKVVCVACQGMDASDQHEQLRDALYGIAAVTHDDSPQRDPESALDLAFSRPIAERCYYFNPSLFKYHDKSLAAAIVIDQEAWYLYVNSIAHGYAQLRQSRLYQWFSENAASHIIDPSQPHSIDDAYVVVPRKESQGDRAMLDQLKVKYGLSNPIVHHNMQRHRILVSL